MPLFTVTMKSNRSTNEKDRLSRAIHAASIVGEYREDDLFQRFPSLGPSDLRVDLYYPGCAVEHNHVEVRILLDEADEVAELGDGRRRDRVNRRVVERHMAVSGVTAFDSEVPPRTGWFQSYSR
jgi:hypothetical protein